MKNTLRLFTLTIFVFLSFVCQGRADELKDIFQSAAQMPSLLKSYQVSYTVKASRVGAAPVPDKRIDVWQSGSNIKVKSTWLSSAGTKNDALLEPIEYAFNGTDYQWLVTGHKALTFSKQCRHPTPYWDPSPLMWPYYWIAGQQTNWSDIKDLAKWDARFKEAKFLGHRNVIFSEKDGVYVDHRGEGGMHFDSVSFPFPQMNMDEVHVTFAKDIGYYPLVLLGLKGGSVVMNAKVARYKIFDIDGMPFVFPLNVDVTIGTGKEDFISMHWTVDESSIKINPQLDEDMFTISPSRAATVTDFDKMLDQGILPSFDVADDGRDIVYEPPPTGVWSTQKIVTLVTVNVVVLAFLIYLLLSRKK
jgi:hypothetical protein